MRMKNLDPGPMDYLVKCIAGRFEGRFAHVNRKVGELFGTAAGGAQVTMCIEDAGLSDRHAKILFDPESHHYFLVDEGSADGTWVAARWRRSVEISAGQELKAGNAPAVLITQGSPILEEDEVAHWLGAYQLRYLAAKFQEQGIRSLADLRARADQVMDLVGDSFNEAEEQSVLSLAVDELDRMFPLGQYTRHTLKFLLRPAELDMEPEELCEVGWESGVLLFSPGHCAGLAEAVLLQSGVDGCPQGERALGVVPCTGWSRWDHLKVGFSFGRYYVHWHANQNNESLTRCLVRLGPGQRHWLQPQDVFRIGSLEFQVLRFNTGVYAEQGRRSSMEDEDIALQDLAISHWRNSSLFGIYDGHGGRDCVEFLRHNLHMYFIESITARGGLDRSTQVFHDVYECLKNSFLEADKCFINLIKEVKEGTECGSTAVVACVIGGWVFCANCGDSRAVLCREGRAIQLSLDHTPARADELARIEAAGGFVSWGRVMGRLALSRAFGDADYKVPTSELRASGNGQSVITAEPEIRWERLTPQDEFLLLGCDGLFDVFSTQEAVDFARKHLAAMPPGEQDPNRTVRDLVREAIQSRGSRDNVTAMLVVFKRCIMPVE